MNVGDTFYARYLSCIEDIFNETLKLYVVITAIKPMNKCSVLLSFAQESIVREYGVHASPHWDVQVAEGDLIEYTPSEEYYPEEYENERIIGTKNSYVSEEIEYLYRNITRTDARTVSEAFVDPGVAGLMMAPGRVTRNRFYPL